MQMFGGKQNDALLPWFDEGYATVSLLSMQYSWKFSFAVNPAPLPCGRMHGALRWLKWGGSYSWKPLCCESCPMWPKSKCSTLATVEVSIHGNLFIVNLAPPHPPRAMWHDLTYWHTQWWGLLHEQREEGLFKGWWCILINYTFSKSASIFKNAS